MGIYLDKAKILRARKDIHYNCAQTVLCAFCDAIGCDEELLYRTASCFGGGMRMHSVCGAYTGGLMALGLLGLDNAATISLFTNRMKAEHEGTVICSEQLKLCDGRNESRKLHCDNMVFGSVSIIEDILLANKHDKK